MDRTVTEFFSKEVGSDDGLSYAERYRLDHSPRLAAMLKQFKLEGLKDQKVADIGGGLGFLGELLPGNDYWVFDGAEIRDEQRVCLGTWVTADLQRDNLEDLHFWQVLRGIGVTEINSRDPVPNVRQFDLSFCCETLEHLSDPYHCLAQMKAMTKIGGEIILSIPTETVTHNVPYVGLLWPPQNFAQFLGQMALPITEFWEYKPVGRGWPAYHFRCTNLGWEHKRMAFPKHEDKFRLATPLQMTNL